MPEFLESAILGIIQGLTEFLPVSSSGHLEIAKFIFGDNQVGEESLLMTVVLHFATALSTMVVFRKDILEILKGIFTPSGKEERTFALLIIISMIPAGLAGVFLDDFIAGLFSDNLVLVCSMLLVTAVLLYIADTTQDTSKTLNPGKALIIGIAQAIAILPGISRSGATISTALLLGVEREKAARFSFLMVIPLIFGKMILDLADGDLGAATVDKTGLAIGFIAAFITGWAACTWMLQIVKKAQLKYFAIYCVIVAIIGLSYVYSR